MAMASYNCHRMTWMWGLLAAVATLWPGRISGPLDGAPFDSSAKALLELRGRLLRFLVGVTPHDGCAGYAWRRFTSALGRTGGDTSRRRRPRPRLRA